MRHPWADTYMGQPWADTYMGQPWADTDMSQSWADTYMGQPWHDTYMEYAEDMKACDQATHTIDVSLPDVWWGLDQARQSCAGAGPGTWVQAFIFS